MKRATALFLTALATMLVGAPAAFADDGVGLAGPASDKTVTLFCFGVMIFFVAVVVIGSLILRSLEIAQGTSPQRPRRFG